MGTTAIAKRLHRLNWESLERSLWDQGHAITPPILTRRECEALVGLYPRQQRFRTTIDMAPRRFGIGDYKYFRYPLPRIVQALRNALYSRLAPVANGWAKALRIGERYPPTLGGFLKRCHRGGQARPTPLILHYQAGGYNCLHQDVYGSLAFPLQVTAFLSRPDRDYSGGSFLLLEQRPRAQSMCDAIIPEQGALVLFANRFRPEQGTRGYRRLQLKHGVSRVLRGKRYTLGIIFHDAK